MARTYPATEAQFRRLSGVSDAKWQAYGAAFIGEIAEHLGSNPRQAFADESFTAVTSRPPRSRGELLGESVRESLRMFRDGLDLAAIARVRDLSESTVSSHLVNAIKAGETLDLGRIFTPEGAAEMRVAFEKTGWEFLSGAHAALGGRYDYTQLRLFRAVHARSRKPEAGS
jgi:ATP-dependent DNA helicase RecQ